MIESTLSRWVTALSIIGSLICINVLAVQNFFRIDLTSEGVYTLSDASKKTMGDLEDPIAITAYFTKDLPPPFSQNSQFVRDLLQEYRAAAGGKVSYQFIDPESQETDDDKEVKKEVKQDIFGRSIREPTSVEKELTALGIQPVQIQVIEEDKRETKRAYMGIVVRYQDKTETLPVVQQVDSLEYQLTTLIRNLTRTRIPVLGFSQGHGEPAFESTEPGAPGPLDDLKRLLSQTYEVKALDMKAGLEEGKIPESFDAVIVIGPTMAFDEASKKALDAFIAQGKSAAFFVDNASVDLRTFQVTPVDHGLSDLLSSYGIDLGPQLIADAQCSSLMVTRMMGRMRVQQPLKYPFVPELITLEPGSSVTRGLTSVTLPFVTPVYLGDDIKELKADDEAGEAKTYGRILARSSENSWLEDANAENLSPRRFTEAIANPGFTGPYGMMAQVEGALKPLYGEANTSSHSRVMVVGTSGLIDPQFLSQPNAALTLNIVDWLLLDPALLQMRNRGMLEAPLDPDLSEGTRNFVKWGNVIGVPMLLLLALLAIWQMRKSKRNKLAQGLS